MILAVSAPLRVAGAVLLLVSALVRFLFAVLLWGGAFIYIGALLYTIGMLGMPIFPSLPALLPTISTVSALLTSVVQTITDSLAEAASCTLNDFNTVFNRFGRMVFALAHSIINILNSSPINAGLPDLWSWATRESQLHAAFGARARLFVALDEAVRVSRTEYDTPWARARHMARTASPRFSAQPRDIAEDLCDAADDLAAFLIDLIEILRTFEINFFNILGNFWSLATGFSATYLEMFIQMVILFLIENIPYVDCLIDPESVDVTSLSFEINVRGFWTCICPWSYSNITDVPPEPRYDLMVLKCICPSDSDNIITILLQCTHLDEVVNLLEVILDTVVSQVTNAANDLETVAGLFTGIISDFLSIAQDAFDTIESWKDPFKDVTRVAGRGVRFSPYSPAYRNVTLSGGNATLAMPTSPLARAQTLRISLASLVSRQPRTAPAAPPRRYNWAAKFETLTPEQQATLRDPWGTFSKLKNASFADNVARAYGDEVGAHAQTMQAGFRRFIAVLPEIWGMDNVHKMIDALMHPEIVAGVHAAGYVVRAHREARGDEPAYGRDQARAFVGVATRALIAPRTLERTMAQLRTAGDHAGAEAARQFLGRAGLDVPSHVHVMRMQALKRENRASEHRRAMHQRAAYDTAVRSTPIAVHGGLMGGILTFSMFSQTATTSPTQLASTVAGVLGYILQAVLLALVSVLTTMMSVASAFFHNLAHPDQPLQNDVVSSLMMQVLPVVSESYTIGYTEDLVSEIGDYVIDMVEAQANWVAVQLLRGALGFIAPTRQMFTDGNGKPTESVLDWVWSAVFTAPVDAACFDNDDCDTYTCRWQSNPSVECTRDYPFQVGICLNATTWCYHNSACSSGTCLAWPAYNSSCPDAGCSTSDPVGYCFTELCSTNSTCPGTPGQQFCYDRLSGTYCTDEEDCPACRCVAFPLRPHMNITSPDLTVDLSADCAEYGMTLDGLAPYEYGGFSMSVGFFLSGNGLAWHRRCLVTLYYWARLLVASLVGGWDVPRTLVFTPFFAQIPYFLPTAGLGGATHLTILGGVVKDITGGVQAALSLASKLRTWPWPIYLIGDQIAFIAEFQPSKASTICLVAGVFPAATGSAVLVILLLFLGALFVSGVLGALVRLVFWSSVGTIAVSMYYARSTMLGARIARAHHASPVYTSGQPLTRSQHAPRGKRRHLHIHDIDAGDLVIRPPHGRKEPLSWPRALMYGTEMALGALPAIVYEGGFPKKHLVYYLRDSKGHVHKRLNIIHKEKV